MSEPFEDVLRARAKAELRKRMRGLRKTAPLGACLERSKSIIATLATLPQVASAKRVALFWPIEARHEVDLRALDGELRARGAEVFYPSLDPDTNVMTFRLAADVSELEERGFGFSEPLGSAPEAGALDVIVVPALAVSPSGHRLGYGAGYYDRTLPRFAPPAVSVVVAYDYQLLAELPVMPFDVACNVIVTDKRVLRPE